MAVTHPDETEYRELVEPFRGELHAHCYRMLGSLHDAEDALQDALLRAWRGLARFEGRSSLRAWLYRIATNACLDLLARRPRRVLPIDYGPALDHHARGELHPEVPWLEPYPDVQLGLADGLAGPAARYEQRESLELAFVAAMQHLAPRPRAVLILREVLGFSAREVADTLETSVAAVNSALQRARRVVDERLPAESQQETLRRLGHDETGRLVQRFMEAMERADIDAVVDLLADEPVWSMPPIPQWYRGRAGIVDFLRSEALVPRWRRLPAWANGQPAVGGYLWDEQRGRFTAAVLDVLTLEGRRIREVTAFVWPDLLPRFGLPESLPGRMP